MPSPLGHALGGMAAGWLVAGIPQADGGPATLQDQPASPVRARPARVLGHREAIRSALWFGALGALADADFLFGTHSTYSHSIGAVAIVFVLTLAAKDRRRPSWALASAAAYGTHVLFDWLGTDTMVPVGILAMWPLSDAFYQSDAHLFAAIERRSWLPGFWAHNLQAVAWELLVLLPVVGATAWIRSRTISGQRGGAVATRDASPRPATTDDCTARDPGRRRWWRISSAHASLRSQGESQRHPQN